jgi:hypothetical protein
MDKCKSTIKPRIKQHIGTCIHVEQRCDTCGYCRNWSSQLYLGGYPAGNILLSSIILYSGSILTVALRMLSICEVSHNMPINILRSPKRFVAPCNPECVGHTPDWYPVHSEGYRKAHSAWWWWEVRQSGALGYVWIVQHVGTEPDRPIVIFYQWRKLIQKFGTLRRRAHLPKSLKLQTVKSSSNKRIAALEKLTSFLAKAD